MATVTGDSSDTDVTFFKVTDEGLRMEWDTNDSSHVGTYTVTVTASSGCTTSSVSYTVVVAEADPCLTDTLTLGTGVFASPAFTYNIRDDASTFEWTDSAVTSDNSLITCGPFTWEVTKIDGDSSIFYSEDYASTTKYITVYTTEINKAATYSM